MESFLGNWKMVTSEGFDRVMTRLGVDYITRKAGNAIKPVINIAQMENSSDTYTLKTVNTFRTTEVIFKLEQPFLETTVDGRRVKTVITLERGTEDGSVGPMILKQCQVGDKVTDIERRLIVEDLMLTVGIQYFEY